MTVPAGPEAGRDNEYEALIEEIVDQLYPEFQDRLDTVVPATLAAVADLIDGWAEDESNWYLASDHYRAVAARLRGLGAS